LYLKRNRLFQRRVASVFRDGNLFGVACTVTF
jgi:hypothetical protein